MVRVSSIRGCRGALYKVTPRGKRITISTSKIRNKIVSKKNRREKGIRALLRGSNPHSKGVSFSRCLPDFLPRARAKTLRRREIKRESRLKAEIVYNNRS